MSAQSQDVYSRKGNLFGKDGIVQTIPDYSGEYLVFTLLKPNRKFTEKMYSAARKKVSINSHQELLKYRGLLARLVGSQLRVKRDQALLDTNLADYFIRKKLPFLPTEIQTELIHASSTWKRTEQGFKLTGPQTIQFLSLVKTQDIRVLDTNNNFKGIVEGVTQAQNGTIMLSLLTQIPTDENLPKMLKAWVAKRNADKKIANRLKIPKENALTLRNIMRYRIVQGHFKNLSGFNQFRQEAFSPITLPFQGIIRIESDHIIYKQTQIESKPNEEILGSQPPISITDKPADEEIFYSFEELFNED